MADIKNHTDVLINIFKQYDHFIGCEVGVHTGQTSIKLLQNLPKIKKYHAVDPWKTYEQYNGSMYRKPGHKVLKTWSQAKQNFLRGIKPFSDKVIIHEMTSIEAVKTIEDGSLDWIFIDANHDYPYIKENLELWPPKVKSGGVVSGHDYGNKWEGIKRAVDEFVPAEKLNIEPFYVWWYIK